MSLLRKGLLAVLPVVALCVPFMAAAPAQAHEHWDHHDHWSHYGHHVVYLAPSVCAPGVVCAGPSVVYSAPSVVYPAPPVTLFYRTAPTGPWLTYNTYPGYDAAHSVGLALRTRGFEFFIR